MRTPRAALLTLATLVAVLSLVAELTLVGGLGLVSAAAAPVSAAPGPPVPYVKDPNKVCVSQGAPPTTVKNGVGWAQELLQFTGAWQFTRGAGVKVAVIDTGITDGPEFSGRLTGLADLVQSADTTQGANSAIGPGLDDCDGHGTLVAGIIAAAPDAASGFTGVAPEASLLSIRQSSEYFTAANQSSSSDGAGAGTSASLAQAIDFAVANGAGVINVSEAHCGPAGTVDSPELTTAVQAAVAANVVIVVAAGNLAGTGSCSQQNTPGQPAITAATPADLPGVLTVAAVAEDGQAAAFSIAGPWVGVAGPGTDITATNPFRGGVGQVNQITTQAGTGTIQGTSFSAPYVSGVAALVRARFPNLTAAQVIHRIEATAAHPAAPGARTDYVGFGMVNPVAAVTAVLPEESAAGYTPPRAQALAARSGGVASSRATAVALIGSGIVLIGLLALAVVGQTRRARRKDLSGRSSIGSASRPGTQPGSQPGSQPGGRPESQPGHVLPGESGRRRDFASTRVSR